MLTRLSDGTRVVIRPIRSSDKAMLARGLELLPEETRRRRFLGAKPRLTSGELRYLTEVDGEAHFALVAVLADRLDHVVAVARYVRLPGEPGTADAAIVVGDPWQRRGLGRRLAVMLADAARAHGVRRFSATMLSDNPAALALMRTLAHRLEGGGHQHGVREVVAELAA
ncbi:MAG TPA: GNAT family N-acetyltransferase [Thermoleophilaceae bacterium]|nr:GNAT family N-acetyltransferase [Thermoleophilaceae bacterium]